MRACEWKLKGEQRPWFIPHVPLIRDAAGKKKENGTLKHNKHNKDEEIFKDSAKCPLGMCHRVLVFAPKKGEFKSQQVQHRGAGKGRGKGLF